VEYNLKYLNEFINKYSDEKNFNKVPDIIMNTDNIVQIVLNEIKIKGFKGISSLKNNQFINGNKNGLIEKNKKSVDLNKIKADSIIINHSSDSYEENKYQNNRNVIKIEEYDEKNKGNRFRKIQG